MKHLKILGLSLLALVGAMAVSASVAQANWQLLRNGVSVSSLQIIGSSTEDSELLVANGIEIHCGGFTGSAKMSLNAPTNTVLSGTATVTSSECYELNFGEICEVHSTGQPNGNIVSSSSGKGGMVSAEEIYLQSGNEQHTRVEFAGPECPLAEIDGITTGEVKLTILTASKDEKSHAIHTGGGSMRFGEEEMEVDNETGGHLILGTSQEATGATFAVHLIGL